VHPSEGLAEVLFLVGDEDVLRRQPHPRRGDLRGEEVAIRPNARRHIPAGDDKSGGEAALSPKIAQELRPGDLSAAMQPEDDVDGGHVHHLNRRAKRIYGKASSRCVAGVSETG